MVGQWYLTPQTCSGSSCLLDHAARRGWGNTRAEQRGFAEWQICLNLDTAVSEHIDTQCIVTIVSVMVYVPRISHIHFFFISSISAIQLSR